MLKTCLATSLALMHLVAVGVQAQTPEKTPNPNPDYSKEAFIIERFTQKVKFENDGTTVSEVSARVRVQSDAGVQHYGLLEFQYASGTGPFEIEYVRVRKADGTIIDTPSDNIQDMPQEITRQAPFYSDLREKHVAVKGLAIGDVLEYKTIDHVTKPLAPGQFCLDYTFSHDIILLQEQLEISVPRDRAIKWKSPEYKPTITDAGAYRVYTWSGSNLERITSNEKIEAAKTVWESTRGRFPQPEVQLTSFQSWDEVGRWYGDLQKERAKPTPEIQAKAAELTRGAQDEDAKLHAIYNYVSTQFRYIGIAFGVGRYQPHFAGEVLANQYGDCKDKHTLLASLLSASGIKAYPALISSQRDMDADMPSLAEINHVITVIPRGNSIVWLDTTSEVGPYQYLLPSLRDKHALVIWDDKPAGLVNTPANLPFQAAQTFQMQAVLDDNGTLRGKVDFGARGDLEVILRSAFRSTPMPQWKDLTQRFSMNLGFSGEVSEVTASSPEKTDEAFHLQYKYLRKDFGDWPNRRIVAPNPYISLPDMSNELAVMPTPFLLGEPLEIDFHSVLELPKGYTPELPAAIHAKHDFAEFDATYSLKESKMISDRHMRILVSELPKSDGLEYMKFCKIVQNDYQSFISLTSERSSTPGPAMKEANVFISSIRDLPDSSNPEALRLEGEGREAVVRKEFQTATSSLYRAVAVDPKFVRAWLTLGELLMALHQTEAGMDAFQKAIAADPQQASTHKMYAFALAASGKSAEAVSAWQGYVKLAPEDPDGYGGLGMAQLELKHFDEAAQALESALRLHPQSLDYQSHLAFAYLHAGKAEKAETSYHQLLTLNPPSAMLDQAAYDMADATDIPPVALDLAQKAVRIIEETSVKIDLENPSPGDEELTRKLASYWGTLGLVQLRQGKVDDAQKYLLASWKLTQNGIAAAHLCELYLTQNKVQSALQMCRFAKNRLPMESNPIPYRVAEVIEQNDVRLEKLSPGTSKGYNTNTIDQILAMRDFRLPTVFSGTATATFIVLLEFAPNTSNFKVQDVKFVSGADKLKTVSKALTKINFNLTSPDGNPIRVLRRGTFICGVGCEFMLPDANAIPSQPIPFTRAN
jgi:tetratricopeptide (TPR) repeat protein